ncbi:MAG: DHHW family protein [Clostridia bacterium]|nr:DHHW family protein [Clostridia bacterium]
MDYEYDMDAPQELTRAEVQKRRFEKKRRNLNEKLSGLSVLVFALAFAVIIFFLLFFPRPTETKLENRKLAEWPKFSLKALFTGKYTGGIKEHYNDTAPYRDDLKGVGDEIRARFGFTSKHTVKFSNGVRKVTEYQEESRTPKATSMPGAAGRRMTEATERGEEANQKDFRGIDADGAWNNGQLTVYQDGHYRCMELFGGGVGSSYAEALNYLHGVLGNTVTIYSMPCPLACEFYLPKNYADCAANQSDCFDKTAEKLDDGIVSINVCPVLAKHTEENIYSRTDHHWQSLGAYYACRTFAETAGVPFADLSKYEKGSWSGYVGTMYAFSRDANLKNDPEEFVYYKPTCDYESYYYDQQFNYSYNDDLFWDNIEDSSSYYLTYIHGDSNVVKTVTNVRNGRRLLVVKDSYGNAQIPFYSSSFEQIIVVDMRYFERNLITLIETMDITDVLFTCSSFSVVGGNADNLMNLMTQDAYSDLVDNAPTASSTND